MDCLTRTSPACYLQVNRLDEVTATAREAQAHNLDSPLIHFNLYSVDFLQHDAAGMEREAAALMGKAGFEDLMLDTESNTAAYGGQFAKARELTRRASDSAQRADQKETAAAYEAEGAAREVLVGYMGPAKQQAQGALALSDGRNVEAISAIALGLAGDGPQATRLAADLAKRFPEDTIVQFEYLPMIHAAAALQSGNATKAIEALAPAAPYELGSIGGVTLYPVYLRGEGLSGGAPRQRRGSGISENRGPSWDPSNICRAFIGKTGPGTGLCDDRGCSQGKKCVSGFPRPLERRRPRHPHPEGSQGGVREAAVGT